MEAEVDVVEADLARSEHARDVVAMTAAYALDPFGNSGPLPEDVLERLVPALRAHPTALVFLAYRGGEAVGIATCFLGFSTFAARPVCRALGFGGSSSRLVGDESPLERYQAPRVPFESRVHDRPSRGD